MWNLKKLDSQEMSKMVVNRGREWRNQGDIVKGYRLATKR